MTEQEIRDGLRKLGYSQKWIEYGFLDQETLRRQLLIFDSGEDPNTEHYRYGAFSALLDRPAMTDIEIENIVELAMTDADHTMAVASLMQFIRWRRLTDHQREMLRSMPALADRRYQREFDAQDLVRELNCSVISDDLFRRCLEFGDGWLLQHVAGHPGTTVEQLLVLVETGHSKAIRHTAAFQLAERDETSNDMLMELATNGQTKAIRSAAAGNLRRRLEAG